MARFATTGSMVGWLALLGAGLAACSTEDTIAGPPRGPDDLRISRVDSAATFHQPDPVTELQLDACEPLLVTIKPYAAESNRLGNFALAQPGGCDGDTNCGWIVVTATGTSSNAAGDAVAFAQEYSAVQSPMQIDLPSGVSPGEIQLTVELRDANGTPVTRDNGKILKAKATVTISTTGNCL